MKGLALAGVVVLVLGIVSFFIPMPHSEHHGVNVVDAHIGVTTEHDEKVPPALSVVLVVVGAGLVIAGRKAGRRDAGAALIPESFPGAGAGLGCLLFPVFWRRGGLQRV